jgi:hypothetical protein
MKVFKLALLGTAALAAASMSARADNLADLKAQIETLNARVASLEVAPAVPADYSMVAFSKMGDEHIISIVPTADAPTAAPETKITWAAIVRGGVLSVYDSSKAVGSRYSTDVWAEARMKVVGKTDTAVGEVGVSIGMVAKNSSTLNYNAGNNNVTTDGYYGWWKLTPTTTLSAGIQNPIQKGTLARNLYSFDAVCACYQNDSWGVQNAPTKALSTSTGGSPAQFALSYADGPIGLAVALEDSNNNNDTSAFGGSAKATYKMDIVGFDLSGGYWGNTYPGGDASWAVNAGVGVKFDPVTLGATVGAGHYGLGNASSTLAPAVPTSNYDYILASGFAKVALGDSAGLELGIAHDFGTAAVDKLAGATLFEGGIYYTPVKQLVVGVEGQYQSGGVADQSYIADLVTVFKF